MKKQMFYFLVLFAIFASCQNQQQQNDEVDTITNVAVTDTVAVSTNDSVVKTDTSILADAANKSTNDLPDISGVHNLTLQWISWDRPGKVKFTKTTEPNVYKISGEQRSAKLGYVIVDGTVKMISPLELEFEGVITINLTSTNSKETECKKEGKQTFLSTKNRKYWRLQNMQSCYNNGTIDYVDIYF